jgi:hypothetical protein
MARSREAQLCAAPRLSEFDQHIFHLAGAVAEFLHSGIHAAITTGCSTVNRSVNSFMVTPVTTGYNISVLSIY